MNTQHERDRETGLDYRGARYYDSDVARFLSLDPLAAKYPMLSPYNYVAGNPIIFIDPDGREIRNSKGEDISTPKHEKETRWTENHVRLNEAFGDANGFNQTISNKISANILSGGVTTNPNGIDINVEVTGAEGAVSINVIQIVRVSNDDNFSKSDAHGDNKWISSSGGELGFVDAGGFYYGADYNEYVSFDPSTGSGKIHFKDHGTQINNPSIAYNKSVFHAYFVARYNDNSMKVIGRIEYVFFKTTDNKIVPWSENNLKIISGGFTKTDNRIFEISIGR